MKTHRRPPPARSLPRFLLVTALGLALAIAAVLSGLPRSGKESGAAAGNQPQTPITAAFFYPWYPSHWTENGVFPFTNYTPYMGYYSSTDVATISEQLSLAQQARVDAFISSWWEPGEVTDVNLKVLLNVTSATGSPVKWATYYEREGYSNPSAALIASDLQYMNDNLFGSPAYLHVEGKPVVFAYGEGSDGCATVNRWLDAQTQSGIDVFVVLKVFYGYTDCAAQPESWHQYSPTSYFDYQPTHSVSISPGFWKWGDGPVLERDAFNFEYAVQWMAVTDTTWRLITTWNEWAEGTGIEPAIEYGDTYIDILCRNLPGPTPCGNSSATPAPTPASPTATPWPTPAPTPVPTSTPVASLAPTQTPTPTPTPAPSHSGSVTPTNTPEPTLTPTPTPAAPSPTEKPKPTPKGKKPIRLMYGDVDCDEKVDSLDALHLLRFVAKVSEPAPCADAPQQVAEAFDLNCDGAVNALDALVILRFVAGMPVTSAAGCPAIGSTVD